MVRRHKKKRAGIVLLVVLSLLVLFVVLGVTFVVVSGQNLRAASSHARIRRTGDDPRKFFDIAIKQFLRDTRNENSSLLGQGLLRDLYGDDGVRGVVVSAAEQAGGQFVLIRYRPERGVFPIHTNGQNIKTADDYYNGRVLTILDTMWHPGFGKAWGVPGTNDDGVSNPNGTDFDIGEAGWPGSDDQLTHGHRWTTNNPGQDGRWGVAGVDDNSDGVVDDLWEAGWLGSDDLYLSGSLHSGTGHMVHPGADGQWGRAGFDDDNDGIVDDSDEAGWPGSDDGFTAAPGVSVRIVDSGFDPAPGPNSPGVLPGEHFWVRVEMFTGDIPTRLLPTAGTRLIINGAPFNGTGAGYDTRHLTQNMDAYLPLSAGNDNEWGAPGMDDDGDGASANDSDEAGWLTPSDPVWPAPPTSNDDFVLPVALAPHIAKYRGLPSPTSNPFAGGVDESWDAVDFQNMFLAMVPGDMTVTPYVIPSFHRPELVNYLYTLSQSSGPPFGGMWNQPEVRRAVVMRPMPWEHPNFTGSNPWFDGATYGLQQLSSHLAGINSSTNAPFVPWDVDNDGDGVADSIWLDIGLPLQTASDGRRYKPLVAILCKDMDGRLNLNYHGDEDQLAAPFRTVDAVPTGGSTAPFAGDPNFRALTGLPRGQGYGPAEISLAHVLAGQYATILAQRYGGDAKPGVQFSPLPVPTDDSLSNVKHQRLPVDWPNTLNGYASPPDLRGRGAVALDYFGQPMFWYMGLTGERLDNPYQFSLDSISINQSDSRFTSAELERLLRWFDLDDTVLTDRLRRNAAGVFSVPLARALFTNRSSHLPVPPVTVDPDQFPGTGPLPRTLNPSIIDLFLAKLDTTSMTQAQANRALKTLIPFELRRGGLLNVNRPWANGLDDNLNLVVDEPYEGDGVDDNGDGRVDESEELEPNGRDDDSDGLVDELDELARPGADLEGAWFGTGIPAFDGGLPVLPVTPFNAKNNDPSRVPPRESRQIYARHLYCLMMLLKPAAFEYDFDGNPTNNPFETARALAQWAVNVVDFRDPDSIMTPFEFDANPFDGWDVDGVISDFPDGIDNDGDGQIDEADEWKEWANGTDDDGDGEIDEADEGIVWGTERPELLITETLAFHDRRTEDLDNDNGVATDTSDTTNPDPTYDQRLRPQGSVFIELYNPWTGGSKLPAEFYAQHPAAAPPFWSNGVLLDKVNRGGSPVWRLAVVSDPASKVTDPDSNPNLQIDRSVYFVANTDPRVTRWPLARTYPPPVNPEKQFTVTPGVSLAQLLPGRYAVIGGRTMAMIGRRTTAVEGDATTLEVAATRQIRITPDPDPNVHQVQVLNNGTITPAPTYAPPQVQPTVGIVVDRAVDDVGGTLTPVARPLSVSEPPNGYETAGWDPLLAGGEGAYATPLDEPEDRRYGLYPGLTLNDNIPDFCRIHLQRLANPLLAWNPLPGEPGHLSTLPVNPYLTIDSSSVDLTPFNGVTNDSSDPELGSPPPPPNLRFSPTRVFGTLQRGADGVGPPKTRALWPQAPLSPPPAAVAEAPGDHYFNFDLTHTLGFLNENYQPMFLGGMGGNAPTAFYAGAPMPDTTTGDLHAFPWLTWNNRPFVSPHELLLVPRSRSERLLRNSPAIPDSYTLALGLGENYAARAATFNHLLNFFDQLPSTSPPTVASQLHRIFDYLEVPSLYLGTDKWYNPDPNPNRPSALPESFTLNTVERTYNQPPAVFAPPQALAASDMFKPADEFRPPFNQLSRFRDPGRINLNTIFDEDVWEGIAKLFPGMDSTAFWTTVKDSRRDYYGNPNSDLDPAYPTRFGNPFRSSASAKLAPTANMRKEGASVGLLRTVPGSATNPLFNYTSAAEYEQTNRNPYFRYAGLSRLSNLLTTHSNVFAVWITVGYFEVEANPNGADAAHPDGYRLSREVGAETGEIKRNRAFYIIDRSVPVAFEQGEDHNVDKTILLNRFIE